MTRYSADVEQALLGDLLALPHRIGEVVEAVVAEDFYRPAHRLLFGTIKELWSEGAPVDTVTVVRRLEERGVLDQVGGMAEVVTIAGKGSGGYRQYVRTVTADALARRLAFAHEAMGALFADATVHPADALELAKLELSSIDVPAGTPPRDLSTLAAFLSMPPEQRVPWVVPGLLRRGWRVLIVAPEGRGKTVVTQQLAVLCAQGVHPFSFDPIPPQRVLLIDLENPEDAIGAMCNRLSAQVRRVADVDDDRAWLWHRPAGLDLRSRTGRSDLEAAVVAVRPDLVCLGPLYKAYRVSARENDELAAGEVQHVLDDLRARHRFALVVEHHAPKSQGGRRELSPYGSSLWLRWPEQGIRLTPDTDKQAPAGRLVVDRWRGDRLPAAWPDALERGKEWPWVGWWANSADARWEEPEEGLW